MEKGNETHSTSSVLVDSTQKTEDNEVKKVIEAKEDFNNSKIEAIRIPLHKRRFDAKKKDIPASLKFLPYTNKNESNIKVDKDKFSDISLNIQTRPTSEIKNLCEGMMNRLGSKTDPLSKRSIKVARSTLATDDALDHLEKLYKLMDQLLALKEHNAMMMRRARELDHMKNLKEIHKQIEREMAQAKNEEQELMLHNEAMTMDLEAEYGYTEALLDSMLAAGRSASVKRAGGSKWKATGNTRFRQSLLRKQRSKSTGGDELELGMVEREKVTGPQSKLRRSSDAKMDMKSKISKWTKVKAAFKWEKAHTGVSVAGAAAAVAGAVTWAGGDVVETPKQYKPSVATITEFVLPPPRGDTPVSLTPASSADEMTNEQKSSMRRRSSALTNSPQDVVARHSRSMDGDPLLTPPHNLDDSSTSPSPNKMHKTPWGKMKDIIQTRKESVRRKHYSKGSSKSPSDTSGPRLSENYSLSDCGLSHSESNEILNQSSRSSKIVQLHQEDGPNTPTLTVTMPSSEELPREVAAVHRVEKVKELSHTFHQTLRKQRSLELGANGRPPAGRSRHDSGSDAVAANAVGSSPAAARRSSKWSKVKRAFLTSASVSVPSSPSRHSTFFADIGE